MYLVKAIKWSNQENKQVLYIAGAFPDIANASLFKEAYTKRYSAKKVFIEDVSDEVGRVLL